MSVSVLQSIVKVVRRVLDPLVVAVTDKEMQAALLPPIPDLPLPPPVDVPPVPQDVLDRIQAHETASDFDAVAFGEAVDDLVVIVTVARSYVEALVEASGIDRADERFAAVVVEALDHLLKLLALNYLRLRRPKTFAIMRLLGLVEDTLTQYHTQTLLLDRLGALFRDFSGTVFDFDLEREEDAASLSARTVAPAVLGLRKIFKARSRVFYGWDPAPGSTTPVADRISARSLTFAIVGGDGDPSFDEGVSMLTLTFVLVPREHRGPALLLAVGGSADLETELASGWILRCRLGPASLLNLRYDGELSVADPTAQGTRLSVSIEYGTAPGAEAVADVLHLPGGSRLELRRAVVEAEGSADDLGFKVVARNSELVLTKPLIRLPGGADPVVQGGELRARFDLGIGYSVKRDLFLEGGTGLTATLPIAKSILGVEIRTVTLGIRRQDDGSVRGEISLALLFRVGPVTLSADGIGVEGLFAVPEDGSIMGSKAGFGFKGPTGLGIAVEGGLVHGGGFVSFDSEKEQYSGVLDLQVYDLNIKGIGIIDTSGDEPARMLIILTGEAAEPGYGFAIEGIGGLVGINRTASVEALQAGIRNKSLDHVLFPEDPVATAPQIFSVLRELFPPATGRVLMGGMVIMTWGGIVRVELGVVLELPEPIRLVILGQVQIGFEHDRLKLVDINFDVLGVVDFGQKRASIDASLRDSKALGATLTGEAAVRFSWGEPRELVLSVGGFNPGFQAPPNFPQLKRIMLEFGPGENPRIRLTGYFALTPNTIQLGGSAEIYAEAGGLNLLGWVAGDALLELDSWAWVIDINAGVALRRGTSVIAGVTVKGQLSGTALVLERASGEACLSLLFFDLCVDFDHTFRPPLVVGLPATNPGPFLVAAVAEPANWTAVSPGTALAAATLRRPTPEPGRVVADPAGGLLFTQSVVPLNRKLTRFGGGPLSGPDRYVLDDVLVGEEGDSSEWTTATDFFAAAQFEDLTTAEALSRPSFERMDAGIELAGQAVVQSEETTAPLEYETIIVDEWARSRKVIPYRPPLSQVLGLATGSAAARAPLAATGLRRFAPRVPTPAAVGLDDEAHVVVSSEDLAVQTDISPPTGKGAALLGLADHLDAHPEDRTRLQVVPVHDLGAAA